jgi:8-oxo-dGTP diphosphatase
MRAACIATVNVRVLNTTTGRVLAVLRCEGQAWAPNEYALPGGHVEPGESMLAAAVRELREETGLKVSPNDLHLYRVMSLRINREDRVALYFATVYNGAPISHPEPDKHALLVWIDPDAPPPNTYIYSRMALRLNHSIIQLTYSEDGWS